jgi:deoxyadenosine/deoxycytidine kinase
MGKLVVIVGNSGVGKTTLARQLCRWGDFCAGFEQHTERPFYGKFFVDRRRYALHNQIDYLLLRAEQEKAIRLSPKDGIQDGGVDLDYHVFTRHFFNLGYLDQEEFDLCQQVYRLARIALPPPDLIVHLVAPLWVLAERFTSRDRNLEIASLSDLEALQTLLDTWLTNQNLSPLVSIDADQQELDFSGVRQQLLDRISAL